MSLISKVYALVVKALVQLKGRKAIIASDQNKLSGENAFLITTPIVTQTIIGGAIHSYEYEKSPRSLLYV